MKLTFVGADHQVTGSCHYLQACGRNILVDCGMQQGINPYECCDIPVEEAKLDYVFLTHAHVDHSGNLPLLYAKASVAGSLQQKPQRTCVPLCCVTAHTYRCRKQNGRTEKPNAMQAWKQ